MESYNPEQASKEWAKILIQKWIRQLRIKKIGSSQELAGSFVSAVIKASNGDVAKIQLMYNEYGKFVDMGVGRGTTLSDVGSNRSLSKLGLILRKRKQWYSPTFLSEYNLLVKILETQYGIKVMNQLNFESTVEISM